MCGIAGILNLSAADRVPEGAIERMVRAQAHRGPDGEGIYLDDRVVLGHNRLSIIDLAGGAQPISNEDGRFWIVYNGEIFNYLELKKGLEGAGHKFATSTDTEVIVHLYEEMGASCLEKLNGQFAFALWDRNGRELFLARDRMGILPLHYAMRDGRCIFASEVKAIFASGLADRRLDAVGLDQIFTFWTTIGDRTAFENVHELPAGHYLRVTPDSQRLRRYWDFPCVPEAEQAQVGEKALAEDIGNLILDSVRIRLRADVPVGCYISGGLDSSGITSLVKTTFDNEVRSFGIQFEDRNFDERDHQNFIVSHLGLAHTPIEVKSEMIFGNFRGVLWHSEKPLLRTAPVPLFLLSDEVRRNGYKVVLTGEGADEVFGGYDIFKEAKCRLFWSRNPDSRYRPLLLTKLYPDIFRDPRVVPTLRAFFRRGIEHTADPLFSHRIRWENTNRVKMLFADDFRAALKGYSGYEDLTSRLPDGFSRCDYLARAQYLEASIFLSNYLLSSQGDRVSMAHSVEIRPPFLDHRVVEAASRIPAKWKIRGMNEKYILKKSFASTLPENILKRPKHPYRAPIASSFPIRANAGLRDALSRESLMRVGVFDPERVGKFMKRMESAPRSGEIDDMALAGILSTQFVHDLFVRDFAVASRPATIPRTIIDRRSARF